MEQELIQAFHDAQSPEEDTRKPAEDKLKELVTAPRFCSSLLTIITNDDLEDSVRQLACVYLKNTLGKHWVARDGLTEQFVIDEGERPELRGAMLMATIAVPLQLRKILSFGLQYMIDATFPDGWEGVEAVFNDSLATSDIQTVQGALMAFYAFTKKFRTRKADVCGPYYDLLAAIQPSLTAAISFAQEHRENDDALIALRFALKIYFNSTIIRLPPVYASLDACDYWNSTVLAIVQWDRPAIPEDLDTDELVLLPFFKVQKWATRIMEASFERYGLPAQAEEHIQAYATQYMDAWAEKSLEVVMVTLGNAMSSRDSPRVVRNCLEFMSHAVDSSKTFKLMKPHLDPLMKTVLFPLMRHGPEDDELWVSDPYEYIRRKHGMLQNYVDPVLAAANLIGNLAEKRIKSIIGFIRMCFDAASDPKCDPRDKDGALNILGSLSEPILERKKLRNVVEGFMLESVLPECQNTEWPFLQRRACSFFHSFAELGVEDPATWENVLENGVLTCLASEETPVCVEAAITLHSLLENQEQLRPLLDSEERLQAVVGRLLDLLRDTENDDLTDVLSRLIEIYRDQMAPFAVRLAEELKNAFVRLKDFDPDSEADQHKVMAAQGTIESIKNIAEIFQEDDSDQRIQFETEVKVIVQGIIHYPLVEFTEDALELVGVCTGENVTEVMWPILSDLYQLYLSGNVDYFPYLFSPLSNFIDGCPERFIEDAEAVKMVVEIAQKEFVKNDGDDSMWHALKLMELIITFLEKAPGVAEALPGFVSAAISKFLEAPEKEEDVHTQYFLVQCTNVIAACIINNCGEVLSAMAAETTPKGESVLSAVFYEWFKLGNDIKAAHNRRMSIMAMCVILSQDPSTLPEGFPELWPHIMPFLLQMFNGLDEAEDYVITDQNKDNDDDDDDDDDEDDDEEEQAALEALANDRVIAKASGNLEDDEGGLEDDEDFDNSQLIDMVKKIAQKLSDEDADNVFSRDDSSFFGYFDTPYDGNDDYNLYIIFRNTIQGVSERGSDLEAVTYTNVGDQQQQFVQELIERAAEEEEEINS